jgi:hypothetical protein
MTFSEIYKKLVELGYRKLKGDYTYDDRKYATFSRNTYSVTVFMDSDFNILNLSFQYVGGKYDFIRLVTTNMASLRIMSDEEFMDIISRIDIRKMSKYPVDRMSGVLTNILNEKAIERL